MRKITTTLIVLMFGLGLAGCGYFSESNGDVSNLDGKKMTVYYTPSCNCCKDYVEYLKKQGVDVTAKEKSRFGMRTVKSRHGVSKSAASCHTGVIGDYVVEGHVPAETISKLLAERPDGISGVTIPGMPQHAPGMRGPIGRKLSVFSLGQEGQTRDTYDTVRY